MTISLLNTTTAIADAFLTDGTTTGGSSRVPASAPDETAPGFGSGSAATATTGIAAEEQAVLADLLQSNGQDPSLLAQLTNIPYSRSNPPDVLQVSAGSDVTPEFAGGYKTVGWDLGGAEVTCFATGQPPNVVKGFAIRYGQNTSAASRQNTLQMAQSYLNDHLSDSQNAAGRWNQPTFDVSV